MSAQSIYKPSIFIVIFLAFMLILGWIVTTQSNNDHNINAYKQPIPDLELSKLFADGEERINIKQALENPPDDNQEKPQINLLHFFASWCVTCKLEQPLLKKLSEQPNINIIGIAWNDKPENTKRYLQKYGNHYDSILIDDKGELAISSGLRGTPETMISTNGQNFCMKIIGQMSENILTQIDDNC